MHSDFHVKNYWRENYDPLISTERWIKYIYQRNGYTVKRLVSSSSEINKSLPKFLHYHVKTMSGIPDFLIIDKKNKSFFFPEVKLSENGLNAKQIKWIAEHPHLATVVLFVHDSKHTWYSKVDRIREDCKKFTFGIDNPTTTISILENIEEKISTCSLGV